MDTLSPQVTEICCAQIIIRTVLALMYAFARCVITEIDSARIIIIATFFLVDATEIV